MSANGRGSKGFSLIEIAIVLFIATLIVGTLLQYVSVQLIAAKQTATRAKQDSIKSALISLIARNNRLPCPAIAMRPAGDVGNGVEAPTLGTCAGAVVSGAVVTGTIPWVSLGLSAETSLDGYSNRYT